MFRFGNIEYLYLLVIIPVLILLFMILFSLRKKALRRFGNMQVIEPLMPALSFVRPVIKFMLIVLALTSLIFGIARPQFGSKLREIKREGVEIIIALDVSNSMMAEDIQPNRLERAKQAIAKMVDRLVNDKIGLIVFAGDAYIQIPITTDYVSAKLFLNTISTEIVPKQGTAIGSAIELGMKSFTQQEETSKALIIITDGENHEDDAIETAKTAVEKGLRVHTIGIGLPKGAPIPIYSGQQKNYLKDNSGETVISKLDEDMLRKIAAAGQGVYIRSTDTRVGLDKLFDEINKMEKQEMEASSRFGRRSWASMLLEISSATMISIPSVVTFCQRLVDCGRARTMTTDAITSNLIPKIICLNTCLKVILSCSSDLVLDTWIVAKAPLSLQMYQPVNGTSRNRRYSRSGLANVRLLNIFYLLCILNPRGFLYKFISPVKIFLVIGCNGFFLGEFHQVGKV